MGGATWVELGEICLNRDAGRRPITKAQRVPGSIPYYGASGIIDFVDSHIFEGDYLLVSEDGANLRARTTPIAFSVHGKSWINNHAHVLEFATSFQRKFVEHYLNSVNLENFLTGAAQPKLSKANLERIPIPQPSEAEQKRAVDVLEAMTALVNDLSSGLPAEIAARRKQYEYYRDKLLTFKELQPEAA